MPDRFYAHGQRPAAFTFEGIPPKSELARIVELIGLQGKGESLSVDDLFAFTADKTREKAQRDFPGLTKTAAGRLLIDDHAHMRAAMALEEYEALKRAAPMRYGRKPNDPFLVQVPLVVWINERSRDPQASRSALNLRTAEALGPGIHRDAVDRAVRGAWRVVDAALTSDKSTQEGRLFTIRTFALFYVAREAVGRSKECPRPTSRKRAA